MSSNILDYAEGFFVSRIFGYTGNVHVSFSGGRSSGAMLRLLLDINGGTLRISGVNATAGTGVIAVNGNTLQIDNGATVTNGVTLAAASTLEGVKDGLKGSDKDAAERVGKLVAQRAMEKGVTDVVFDRGGYIYHGRIKALADAAREAGLNF